MSKSSSRRPSPALVISLLALFVALGGSAYAANQLAKNSVGAKQLKKNAVTAAKLKNNAVTTPKIKNEAITGAKIKESSLGPVPSATDATNAVNSTNAVNATNATNFSRYFASGLKKAGLGQTVTLMTVGPFTIIGKCVVAGENAQARAYITTSQPGSSMISYYDTYDEADFNPGTEVELSDYSTAKPGEGYIEWDYNYGEDTEFRAASADGLTLLQGEVVNSSYMYGSPCAWWAYATNMG